MTTTDRFRATTTVVTTARGLGLWALGRLGQWLAQTQAAMEPRLRDAQRLAPEPVQRFGAQLWQRVIARFPGLADLVPAKEATSPRPAAWAAPPRAREVEPTPPPASEVPPLHELVRALRDPSAERAASAATELAPRVEPEARAALLEVLGNADGYFHPLTRVAALRGLAEALPRAASESDLAPLVARLRDVDAEVSLAAIDALAQHAPAESALAHLLPVVDDQTGYFLPVVRAAANQALARAGRLPMASA